MSEAAAAIATAVLLAAVVVTPEAGVASQYAEGVMESVVWNRQQMNQLPKALPKDISGFIAVSS